MGGLVTRGARAVLAGSLVFGGALAASVGLVPSESAHAATPTTLFASTGTGFVTYPTVPAVPSNVCFVEVTAVGGTGGSDGYGGGGGAGGSTFARIPVTPGEQLAVEVGGGGGVPDDFTNGGNGGVGGGGGGGSDSGGGGGA
jgi:hypothetical protein